MKATSILRRYFRKVTGLPCWGVQSEFGTWLSFQFGEPSLDIKESVHGPKLLNRRRVFVIGPYNLWIEMGSWEIFKNGPRPMFHSGQTREKLRRAAAHLSGQILIGISQTKKPLVTEFKFDHGYRLRVTKHYRARRDEHLWHFYLQRRVTSLRADGRLEYGLAKRQKLLRCPIEDAQFSV